MSEIIVTYGKPPTKQTKILAGDDVGLGWDKPEKGMTKIWANSASSQQTFIVPSDDIQSLFMEIIRT